MTNTVVEKIEEIERKVLEEICGEGARSILPSENRWNAFCMYEDGRINFVAGGYLKYLDTVIKKLEEEGLTGTNIYELYKELRDRIEEEYKKAKEV